MCKDGKQHQANHEGRPDHQDPELVHTCAKMGNNTRPTMKEDLITNMRTGQIYKISPNTDKTKNSYTNINIRRVHSPFNIAHVKKGGGEQY